MDNNNINENNSTKTNSFMQIVIRIITSAIILGITAFFTPGFTINNIWSLALASIVLSLMDFIIIKFTGLQESTLGKGFVGFILAAITLYLTQYFVSGYTISWISAIMGAFIYGIVDYFIPEL